MAWHMIAEAQRISIAILAIGGQGGGVLADWLVDLAEHAGWLIQTTSVPGVAQRTGATIYYAELFKGEANGALPVLGLMPAPASAPNSAAEITLPLSSARLAMSKHT